MKEIKTLEDFKSLFDKPIFEWRLDESGVLVFVLAQDYNTGSPIIVDNGECFKSVSHLDDFKPLPKPIEVTAEDCRRWASSEDAIGWQVLMMEDDDEPFEEEWRHPNYWAYNVDRLIRKARRALPTEEASNETIISLKQKVSDWMIKGMEG